MAEDKVDIIDEPGRGYKASVWTPADPEEYRKSFPEWLEDYLVTMSDFVVKEGIIKDYPGKGWFGTTNKQETKTYKKAGEEARANIGKYQDLYMAEYVQRDAPKLTQSKIDAALEKFKAFMDFAKTAAQNLLKPIIVVAIAAFLIKNLK